MNFAVFSKEDCPYCDKIKKVLKLTESKFVVYTLGKDFDKKSKWIFSICHGIQIMIAAGITKGRNLTCYTNIRFEVEQAEAKWINKESIIDGNFITAQTWESHPEFYRDIFTELRNN